MRLLSLLPLLLGLIGPVEAGTPVHYVASNGVDTPAGGSAAAPWATITYALDRVAAGSLILVRPGTYTGRIRIRGRFDPEVTVRSELPYQARLRHDATVLTIYNDVIGVSGIRIEGFDIAHSGPGAGALVVQVQAVGGQVAEDITLADNIIRDSYNNDLLKINNGARRIRVLGNLFYNQSGSDEHIDINSVEEVLVEGNVFFNDFAASGRPVGNDTSSFIVIKDSNGDSDGILGANDIAVRGNVFLNWQGGPGSTFLLCGEDGHPYFEAFDVLIENNLFLGNSSVPIRAAFGTKGCRDVDFRANTVSGNLPGSAYAMRLNTEGSNPANQNIRFHNNLWSDASGTMGRFSTTPFGQTSSFVLRRNLYWNGASALPHHGDALINISDDSEAVIGDPALVDPAGLSTPHWLPASLSFSGGYSRISEVWLALAETYGIPAAPGAGIGQALASEMPADDLLGRPRGSQPDLGALQRPNDVIFADGFEL